MTLHDRFLQAEQLKDRAGWPTLSFADQLRYWETQLDSASVLDLPRDHSHPADTNSTTATHEFEVPGEVTPRLMELSAQHAVSLFDIGVAALQIVLARYTGQQDVAVATPAPGQKNPVVLRSRLTDAASFVDFVLEVRTTVAAAFAHSDVPFDRLVEELALESELARVMVMCEHDSVPVAADVTVRFVEQYSALSGVVEYRTGYFEPTTVEQLTAHL
ncbi:MAG: condensation domain-containing protein, partial [Actinobacteria bacterium]|nr:condensation domain-containing protein [Actinomycetota bacterium]